MLIFALFNFLPHSGAFSFLSTPSGWRATKIPVRDTEVAVFLSTPFQKATKIQLLFNKLIAVAGTNVGVNAF